MKNNWLHLILLKHDSTVQMFVVAERQVVCEVDTVWEGLRSMFWCLLRLQSRVCKTAPTTTDFHATLCFQYKGLPEHSEASETD